MEDRKTIFDYLTQMMVVFGVSMLILNIFCLAFGNSAMDFSAMFALGNQGVPVKIAFEFFVISALITGIRFLFFTDIWIRKMPVWARTVCMSVSVITVIAVFIVWFGWFPIDMWQPWTMFLVCFGVSFAASFFVMVIKERVENRKMEAALKRLKEKENAKNE